jgi:hypothetical protein
VEKVVVAKSRRIGGKTFGWTDRRYGEEGMLEEKGK